jgi:hypothetical protein
LLVLLHSLLELKLLLALLLYRPFVLLRHLHLRHNNWSLSRLVRPALRLSRTLLALAFISCAGRQYRRRNTRQNGE